MRQQTTARSAPRPDRRNAGRVADRPINIGEDRRNVPVAARDRPVNIWTPDAIVKVGYMTLRVVKRIPTPGDGKPDQWELESVNGDRTYRFAPYSGLKLVADRRPKRAAPQSVKRATSDKGAGRTVSGVAAGQGRGAPSAPAPSPDSDDKGGALERGSAARLDRVERLLERLVTSLDRRH